MLLTRMWKRKWALLQQRNFNMTSALVHLRALYLRVHADSLDCEPGCSPQLFQPPLCSQGARGAIPGSSVGRKELQAQALLLEAVLLLKLSTRRAGQGQLGAAHLPAPSLLRGTYCTTTHSRRWPLGVLFLCLAVALCRLLVFLVLTPFLGNSQKPTLQLPSLMGLGESSSLIQNSSNGKKKNSTL